MSAAEDPNKRQFAFQRLYVAVMLTYFKIDFINSFHNACASASLPKPVYENSFDEALNGGTWTSIVYGKRCFYL